MYPYHLLFAHIYLLISCSSIKAANNRKVTHQMIGPVLTEYRYYMLVYSMPCSSRGNARTPPAFLAGTVPSVQ
ncbi:hypothetical protein F4824DRAFT_282599 [Ustulina deusta]|nr:hypothetical protein F4824DRAFT_282599 [Ustulina deusta]